MEKITIPEALTTSLIGICVVMCILAIIAVFIILISKIIRIIEAKAVKTSAATNSAESATPAANASSVASANEVELINTDEKTAAVIMAIVSQQIDIPVNRLSFKSIRLIDENEKGGKA